MCQILVKDGEHSERPLSRDRQTYAQICDVAAACRSPLLIDEQRQQLTPPSSVVYRHCIGLAPEGTICGLKQLSSV